MSEQTIKENKVKPPALVSFFARHANAHNLLMAIMILTGAFFLRQLNTQFFPTVEIPAITISVLWSGASAEDVEAGIIESLEPGLRGIGAVDKITSSAREGFGLITMEFEIGTDMQRATSDVEAAVNETTTLPEEAEKPQITRVLFYENVMSLAVYGEFSEQALKAYALKIRDDLLRLGVDRVNFRGLRPDEIWVEVSEENLRRFDLTIDTISRRINSSSEDLPSGTLSGAVEKQIRSLGLDMGPRAMSRLEVRSQKSGEKLLLRDIAVVRETFDKNAPAGLRDDRPAIRINIQRSAQADILELSNKVDAYLARLKPTLPQSLSVEKFDVQSNRVRQRINVLLKNGAGGLALVLLVLFLFLNRHVAFWVSMGIPTAMIASFSVLFFLGISINMLTLFALIMMLGVVVDDAIVVGEHIAFLREKGLDPIAAAEQGTGRMSAPVFASSLTTIAAFMPMFLISDILGEFMASLAVVVVVIVIMSLVEAFFVLPGHLRHGLSTMKPFAEQKEPKNIFAKIKFHFNKKFDAFLHNGFEKFIGIVYDFRYSMAAGTLGALIISVGVLAGGHVGFQFFPSPEAETIHGRTIFLPGTPKSQVKAALKQMESSLVKAELAFGGGAGSVVKTHFSRVGATGGQTGDNLGEITVELQASEKRSVRTVDFVREWKKHVPRFPGIDRVIIAEQRAGPPGRDIDIRLEDAPILKLKQAAIKLKEHLAAFGAISNIEDDLPWGKRELLLEITPKGYALGFTTEGIGRQVRNAFDGAIARRLPGKSEEIKVRVRLPQTDSSAKSFDSLYLRAPSGEQVPLTDIVDITQKSGFARITRRDGLRTVAITADLNQEVLPLPLLQEKLDAEIMPAVIQEYNISYSYSGRSEEQAETFGDLGLGFMLALAMIYFILAWVLGHYTRPIIVMLIIPFGFIGAVFGHWLMGYDLNMLAMIALLGLAGILINDSIVLVVQIQQHIDEGKGLRDSITQGTKERLRAVILTSTTTIFGLLPLLFEQSLQAAFLKPMAISMAFGVAVGTLLILFIVPSFLGILNDISNLFIRRREEKNGLLSAPKGAGE